MKRWLSIAEQTKNKNIYCLVYSENGFTKGTKEILTENGVFIIK
jgi:hypothetical protein